MEIVIAPNAFKNSLKAADVAEAIREGFLASRLNCRCRCFPIADGGDGTAELIVGMKNGTTVSVTSCDALGRSIEVNLGLIADGSTAVIDLADSSGLNQLSVEERDPLQTTTFGTGLVIRSALDRGVRKIIMGVGGSATVDGGIGILRALGAVFFDAANKPLIQMSELGRLHTVDLSSLDSRIKECDITILCDVENHLLGPNGAAAIFGPQKGASPQAVSILEQALSRLNVVIRERFNIDMNKLKHGGAAGGVAAGMAALLGVQLVNGIDHFLEMNGFEKILEGADLVVTGEGSIDRQTMSGKGPFGVAQRAKKKKIPVIGMAGKLPAVTDDALSDFFDILVPIGNQPSSLERAMQDTYINLVRTARMTGDTLATGQSIPISS